MKLAGAAPADGRHSRTGVALARRLAATCLLAACLLAGRAAAAQNITIDGTLSPAQTLRGPNYTIGAGLGRQIGGNLFQSFGLFGLAAGESATFAGPAGVANIIGRITGGSTSAIDGTIKSAIAGANLFLINPAGLVFGPNAAVNVSGSFHVSTADYLAMADGTLFQATHPDGSTLSAAAPAAFGFLAALPAAIAVNGSTMKVPGTLSLVGGPVAMTGGKLTAAGGTIHIASAAGPGEVPLDPAQAATMAGFGPVTIGGGAQLQATRGGSVFIRAGTVSIDASTIGAKNGGDASGGQIVVEADSQVTLADGGVVAAVTTSRGSAANVTVTAAALSIDGGAISSNTRAIGNGGKVTVTIAGSLSIFGDPSSRVPAGILTGAENAGNAGAVTITAGQLAVSGTGEIGGGTSGTGSAGDVTVTVAGLLSIVGDPSGSGLTGILGDANPGSTGNASAVTVTAGQLALSEGGKISSSTFGPGGAGNVTVAVAGALTIVGEPGSGVTGIFSQANRGSTGDAGQVAVTAGQMAISGTGAVISSSTIGEGAAGDVTVRVAGSLSIAGDPSESLPTGILSDAELKNTGDAGAVTVTAGDMTISATGEISSSTFGRGTAGDIQVAVAGSLSIAGDPSSSQSTGIVSDAERKNTGNAGTVTVTAGQMTITKAGEISSSTFGVGAAGDVTVMVAGLLSITGDGRATSGIFSDAERGSAGNAGEVRLTAGQMTLSETGQVSSSTFGAGSAGDVTVTVAGSLSIAGDSSSKVGDGILSDANRRSTGNAGSVTVTAGQLMLSEDGEISSSTFAAGNAGNVTVTVAGTLSIAGNPNGQGATAILSDAEPRSTGNAGEVSVTAGAMSIGDTGAISSSTFGAGSAGAVTVRVAGALSIVGDPGSGFATGIVSDAEPGATGNAGEVNVTAGQLAIADTGQISSATTGPGRGGDILIVAGDVLLSGGPFPEITASSSGSGAAGNIVVNVANLSIFSGAAISTSAVSSNGGDISLAVGGLLFLRQGAVTTSVFTQSGNGGNIVIKAGQMVLADNARTVAQAILGHGGNIAIDAAAFVPDIGSIVSATSQLGVSGTVTISGGETGLDSSLAVLPGDLRAPVVLLRDACAGRGGGVRSHLGGAGAVGVPPDLDLPVAALYLGGGERRRGAAEPRTASLSSRPIATLSDPACG